LPPCVYVCGFVYVLLHTLPLAAQLLLYSLYLCTEPPLCLPPTTCLNLPLPLAQVGQHI
jgi:hypothetical protein